MPGARNPKIPPYWVLVALILICLIIPVALVWGVAPDWAGYSGWIHTLIVVALVAYVAVVVRVALKFRSSIRGYKANGAEESVHVSVAELFGGHLKFEIEGEEPGESEHDDDATASPLPDNA